MAELNNMTHQEYLAQPHIIEKMSRRITIVRPSKGKPTIHMMASADKDVHQALLEHGWKKPEKIKQALEKKGYVVEFRDFNKGKPNNE